MANLVNTTGVEGVVQNLKALYPTAGKGCERGLKKAGLFLQRESMKIVPVQLGNLKASAMTRPVGGSGWKTTVAVGYTAAYAIYVHENLEAAHGAAFNAKYADKISDPEVEHTAKSGWIKRGPNQQAKFLERPLREKRPMLLKIIMDSVEAEVAKMNGGKT